MTSTRSPVTTATELTVCSPDRVMLDDATALHGTLIARVEITPLSRSTALSTIASFLQCYLIFREWVILSGLRFQLKWMFIISVQIQIP